MSGLYDKRRRILLISEAGFTGSKSKIVFRDLPQVDPRQLRPDIRLAKQVLDWQPETDLTSGLTRTIGYFETFLPEFAGNKK